MPLLDNNQQTPIGQTRFDGGMNMLNPGATQFRDGCNLIIRDGYLTTRPGIRDYLSVDTGWLAGFWFNQDNYKSNDATHTGFWFPFDFVRIIWGSAIQGCELVRLSMHTENKVLFAIGGAVYIYERGYLTEVAVTCSPAFGSTETIVFVQANDKIYMFRSDDNDPLYWDGSDTGFVVIPAPATNDEIPTADNGLWFHGRMWVSVDDDAYASYALEPNKYNLVYQKWDIERGEGEQGVVLYPFHDDSILAFKKRRVSALRSVNKAVLEGTTMADNVYRESVDTKTGALARYCIVTLGEDVYYLGYGGIYSLYRNQQSKTELDPVPISQPIQPYIDRINWPMAHVACAIVHDNYALFAVPVDGSITNNMVLVYDRLANDGQGAWCGPWQSDVLNPVRFFHDDEKLIFLAADGVVREIFTDDPWDSEAPYKDTPQYDATKLYQGVELVGYAYNGDKIWRAITTTIGVSPPDVNSWEEVTDQWSVYNVNSWVDTKFYSMESINPGMMFGRAEVLYRSQNTKVTVEQLSRDIGTEKTIVSEKVYARTGWTVAKDAPWDTSNANLDFSDPYRNDYTPIVPTAGLTADINGIPGGVWKTRAERWAPLMISDKFMGVRITNIRGKIKILGVSFVAAPRAFADRGVA